MTVLITAFVTFILAFITVPIIQAIARMFGLYAIVQEGTCHVYVREPHASTLQAPGADESGMLDFTAEPRRPNSRLSCQIPLTEALDGLTVDLPRTQY